MVGEYGTNLFAEMNVEGTYAVEMKLEMWDLVIIGIYLVVIVALGLWAGVRQRRQAEGAGYFLAGRSLTWGAIGLALFSTNISTLELVSLSQEGFERGLLYGNTELTAPFFLLALSLFFAPFYLRSRVATLPNFLEKRYSRACRYWLVVFALSYAIFGHLGFALFTGGKVVEGLFGMPLMYGMAILLALTGLYTIVGGLKAVVWTEAIQTVILLSGMMVLTAIGYEKVGGWSGFTEALAQEPERLQLLRSDPGASDMTWYGLLLGFPIIGIWFWCTDQTIVQRVLGAKDVNHAQVGAIFAGFIKVLALFLFVFPGLFCYVMVQNGTLPELEDSAQTLPFMVAHLLPIGIRGLLAATMLSALMSTIAGALNSAATVCCYDIYRQVRPDATDKATVTMGRIVTFIAMALAIVWAPFIDNFESILKANTNMLAYVAPSITAVFLWGVFWKKASSTGALWCLASGAIIGPILFLLDWFKEKGSFQGFLLCKLYDKINMGFLVHSFFLFVLCSAILVVGSYLRPQVHTEESASLVWPNPLAVFKEPGWKGIGNYKFLTALLLAVTILVYVIFR